MVPTERQVENQVRFMQTTETVCLSKKLRAARSSTWGGEVVRCRGGKTLPSPVPAPPPKLVISLEVDTLLSEKEDEVIPVGFRVCTRRGRTLRGRMEVD